MNFLSPANLILFFILPGLVTIIIRANRNKLTRLNKIHPELTSKGNALKRAAITTLFFALIILAIARPYSGFTDIKKGNYGSDNLVILDISDSMRADDLKPSRLEIGKRKILDLASIIRERNIGDRIGVILFAGQAYLYCPPTVDFEALKQFVNHIRPELISAQGSGINLALDAASEMIQRLKMRNPRLFIFTDGEDIGFSEEKGVSTLKNLGIKPLILGFGTDSGSPIEIPGEGFIRDTRGNLVITKLNQANLEGLADATGGKYISSQVSLADLKYLLENSDSANTSTKGEASSIRVYNEYGHLFIWAALGLLLLSAIFNRIVPIISISLMLFAPLEISAAPNVYEAHRLYEDGAYKDAKLGFEEALKASPSSPDILQALGSTQFRLGNLKEAEQAFSDLIKNAQNKNELFAGRYNLGNTKLQSKQYDEAIREYEEALKLKPSDEATKFNLELAKKFKEEPPQDKQNKEQPDNKDKEQQKENSSKNQTSEDRTDKGQASEDKNNKDQKNQEENAQNKNSNQNSNASSDKSGAQDKEQQKEANHQTLEDKTKEVTSKNSDETSQQSNTLNEAADKEPNTEDMSKRLPEKSKEDLAKEEADKWLNSLPTAPIQIRKNQERSRVQNGQTW